MSDSAGSQQSRQEASASDTPQTLKLSGTGLLPVTLSPPSLTFPAQPVGTVSAPQVVTVTNNHATVLTLNGRAASGDYVIVTAGSAPCTAILAASASCTVGVGFSPTVTGAISGALTVPMPEVWPLTSVSGRYGQVME